jgi:steroid 5-alpha reductase family enzyme
LPAFFSKVDTFFSLCLFFTFQKVRQKYIEFGTLANNSPIFVTKKMANSRSAAFAWVTLSYILATIAAFASGYWALQQDWSLLWAVFFGDVIGTIIVFAFSYFFDNSSFYDPYWSVQPIVIALVLGYMGWESGADLIRMIVMTLLISFWGVRLTYNWARGWTGLHHQDWRYVQLQQENGKWYWPVSFSGIHMMPTVLVFLGCLPLFPVFTMEGNPLSFLDIVAALFTLTAIMIELTADEQLRNYVLHKKKPGETLTSGLWAYSRHPNYFGETSFWWGLYFFALIARPDYWWTGIGALSITLLFHFISIPMIEKRMRKRRPGYAAIQQRIPRWVPWYPKKD